jgi:serine/threonine protein kinase
MRLSVDYHRYQEGEWSLWVRREQWSPELWQVVLQRLEEQSPSRHPQTLQLKMPSSAVGEALFLKVFHGFGGIAACKDIFRSSRALRSLRQMVALARLNFSVPIAVAAGEQRQGRLLRKAFVLTLAVKGESLPDLLKQPGLGWDSVEKRRGLKKLALEVQRLHRMGFVHGDLVATNIFVSRVAGEAPRFFFMDHDRTRRYPGWIPQGLWRRNLVQLNRMPLPGITLQDRVRFLSHYLGSKDWGRKERRLLAWLERKTRQRRKACDAVDENQSFRQLMRWPGEIA